MISGKDEFFALVEEGRKGNNIGLTIGSPKLELYMDGLLPGTSYLIGGTSGSGKSTFALEAFVFNPLMSFLSGEGVERDPYYILFNLEMTRPQVYAKLVSMYIFRKYGIQLKFKKIFSRGKDCILSDDELNILKECSDFIDILDKRIVCYDGTVTEEIYIKALQKELQRFGHWDNGIFYPNNRNQIVGVLLDHASLIKATSGRSKKDEMDAVSRASVLFRNKTGIISPIFVAQFNRSSGSDERLKQGLQDPTYNDFKDTGALVEDSQVVLAIYSPFKNKQSSWKKYNVKELEQVLVGTFLLKSRFGTSDILVPMGFYGDCSTYAELPKPDEIYDYDKYKTPDWINKEKEHVDTKMNNKMNFTL